MTDSGLNLELVIKGGRVIDPASGLDAARDVGVTHGKISCIAPDVCPGNAKTLDASGLLVTPGLVDLHVHVYHGSTYLGVRPDDIGRAGGTTTMLDAGSSGSHSYRGFKEFVADRAKVRVLGLVNLSSIGLIARKGELLDTDQADVDGAVKAIEEFPDIFIGAKIRNGGELVGFGDQGRRHSHMAVEIAERSDSFLMTHISNPPIPIGEWLAMLRPGDIVTHCFRSGENNLFDENDRVIDAAHQARELGVLFDVGHGSGSFQVERARYALEQGFAPDTISTDLHTYSINGPVYDMTTTMSKFLSFGMSLGEVVRRSCWEPAKAIGWQDRIGRLEVGREADIAVLRLSEEPVEFSDAGGTSWIGDSRLEAIHTIRAGELV